MVTCWRLFEYEARLRMGCVAFFGEIDLVTPSGPVWILGSAIFYEYVVKYESWSSEPLKLHRFHRWNVTPPALPTSHLQRPPEALKLQWAFSST